MPEQGGLQLSFAWVAEDLLAAEGEERRSGDLVEERSS